MPQKCFNYISKQGFNTSIEAAPVLQ